MIIIRNPYEHIQNKQVSKVSYGSIAEVWNTTSNTVHFILKKIISTAISQAKVGVKLYMRVGYLILWRDKVMFESISSHNRWFSSDNKTIEVWETPDYSLCFADPINGLSLP